MHNTSTPVRTVAQRLAALVGARLNCLRFERHEWLDRHEAGIRFLVNECLPRGAGFDVGCELVLVAEHVPGLRKAQASTSERLVIVTSFHHMDENGSYDGWTDLTVVVTPAFDGIDVDVKGKDRDGIFEYVADAFHHALTQPAPTEVIDASVDAA